MSIEEQESLEGHSLHSFSLPVHDRRFLFDTRYLQDMVFQVLYLYCDYPLYSNRLTDQLALHPSMESDYDYDLQ